ncbi:peptidase domain-containing ABC transporter [Clostridium sp. C8-1-8]|uniref:peptidase domain-containing ABC transporter n=1 Tax=Clostridium sp. C8-1-8 TaxID=2698831 RepID=UPI00136B415D|nr:peptidase domain-containing ABC transporter [Clostridium sp. C8-1-8]
MGVFKRYECIKQHDFSDCGPACLATIAKYYGMDIHISQIREYAGTETEGTTVLGLIKAGEKINLKAKAIRIKSFDDIHKFFPKPAIAHVTISTNILHYVVVYEVNDNYITVGDPSRGIVKYKLEDFFKIWTGIIITYAPTKDFVPIKKDNGVYKEYWNLIKNEKKFFIKIFLLSIITTLLGLVGAYYYKYIVDDAKADSLLLITSGTIILLVFKYITEYFRSILLLKVSQNLDRYILMKFYDHVIKLPMNFFRTRKVGEIISRFNDATKIREALSSITITVMMDSIMVLAGIILLFNYNRTLFFLCLIPIILYCSIMVIFKKPLEAGNRNLMKSNSKFYSYLVESLEGIEFIKCVNGEERVVSDAKDRFAEVIENTIKFGYVDSLHSNMKNSIGPIFTILVLCVGFFQVLKGSFTIGELISYSSLLTYFIGPLDRLTGLQSQIQSALVATERLTEIQILQTEKKTESEEKLLSPESLLGEVVFNKVDFRYGTGNKILKSLKFSIKKGSKVAFVGESGSGKTTIAKLLMGFYKVEGGQILINNYNIDDIDKNILREKIAYVSQDYFFFSGTIRQNLEFANINASFDEIKEICKIVQIDEYIENLTFKYNTKLEENATNLSAGQRQRLAIAKALLRNPEILILDEATSNLDSITEVEIQKALDNYRVNNTRIIIAHRLSTIVGCDKIFVFKNGELIEVGSHEELISFEGYYYDLCMKQGLVNNKSLGNENRVEVNA